MNRLSKVAALAVSAIVLTAGGCGPPGDKAGGKAAAITLKAEVGEPAPARDAREQMATYKAKVQDLSAGTMTVEISYGVGGDDQEAGVSIRDTTVVRKVRDGTYDLAWVPARSWDVEALGVKTLRPVSAPFLVDSYALASQIATGHLANELMSGLEDLDVVGLALLPDGLRYPVGFHEPLLRPGDFVGKKIRVPNSTTVNSLFRALGAEPRDPVNFRDLLGTELVGADAAFNFLYVYPAASVVTGNATLYMKMNTIVASAASYNRLTDEQRAILRAAGAATVAETIAAIPDESVAAVEACAEGATVVLASEADLDALEAAAQPVYDELEKDPQTKKLIEAIRDLKKVTSAPGNVVQECGPGASSASLVPSLMPGDQSVLNGTYRSYWETDDLRRIGIAEPTIPDLVGMYTIKLDDGKWEWSLRQDEPTHDPWVVEGTYVVSGDSISITITGPASVLRGQDLRSIRDTYQWSRSGDILTMTLGSSTGDAEYQRGLGFLGDTWTQVH